MQTTEIKLSKSDLVGELTKIPLEIVKMMIKEQVAQGNEANVRVFQQNRLSNKEYGGFNWVNTVNGENFWGDILVKFEFDKFYSIYNIDNKKSDGVKQNKNKHIIKQDIEHLIESAGYNFDKNTLNKLLSSLRDKRSKKDVVIDYFNDKKLDLSIEAICEYIERIAKNRADGKKYKLNINLDRRRVVCLPMYFYKGEIVFHYGKNYTFEFEYSINDGIVNQPDSFYEFFYNNINS